MIEAFNAMYPELVKISATRGQKINEVVMKSLTNPTLDLSNVELQQLVAIADDLIYNKSKVTRQNCTNPYSFPLSEFIGWHRLLNWITGDIYDYY